MSSLVSIELVTVYNDGSTHMWDVTVDQNTRTSSHRNTSGMFITPFYKYDTRKLETAN
jgi:hypothetical protein